jgi:hypothetical protein
LYHRPKSRVAETGKIFLLQPPGFFTYVGKQAI